MIASIRVLALAFVISACSNLFACADEKLDYFVFLVTGKPTQGVAQEEIQKMQAAHLENFRRLAKINELSAAGPCADPEKSIRGIVVINGNSISDAESKFGPDPYVSQGFMKTEIHQYRDSVGKFVIPDDATKMDQHVIAIISQDEKWPSNSADQQSVRSQLTSFAKERHATGELGFAALLGDQTNNKAPRMAVMIFRGSDLNKVTKSIVDLDSVKNKSLRVQVFAQYLVKDALARE